MRRFDTNPRAHVGGALRAVVSEFVHREERYAGWLVAGLVLLLVQQLLAQTWLRRLP